MIEILTGFGDSAVLLPLAAVLLFWLLSQRSIRAALWWLFALGLSTGATSILKIYFFSCPFGAHLNSPSGIPVPASSSMAGWLPFSRRRVGGHGSAL